MKGIMGCSQDGMEPGEVLIDAHGSRITVIRQVDLAAAQEIAASVGDNAFVPVPGEYFYEVEVRPQAPRASRN
jgi:hypothetical protein